MGASGSRKKEIKKEEIISSNKVIAEPDYKILNNGMKCPLIGLGTALIKNEKHINVVYQSIIDGVRLIDIEPDNEELVGKGINKAINNGIIKRKDLFVVTKLKLDEKENPEMALRKSLKRLQLEYVDLYLDHWPSCININIRDKYILIPVKDSWEQMEKLVELKLTKSIGVSNYNVENLLNILSICKIKPVVNEVEFNPYLYQKDLKDFCDKENIIIFGYNPLVKGEYVDRALVLEKKLDLFEEEKVNYIKSEYKNATIGQIILNWHISLGIVPIPGTSKPERMKENLLSLKIKLNKENINSLSSFEKEGKQYRFNDGNDLFGIDIFE